MKTVRDPVHSNIVLDKLALRLVDTPQMQRLRRIKQVGFANILYPGANHTRFEHSLGAYHLAGMCANVLKLDEYDTQVVKCAALLHDLGHGPFSHLTEPLLAKRVNSHEELSHDIIVWSKIADILSRQGVDPSEVAGCVLGKGKYARIVSGDIDVDRMDYLARDAHYTGVKVSVDPGRIVSSLAYKDGTLAVKEPGLPAVEALLVTRFLMYPSVYAHHTSRAVARMMREGIKRAVAQGSFAIDDLQRMDDSDLVYLLRNSGGYPKKIMAMLDERRIFKRAYIGDAKLLEQMPELLSDPARIEGVQRELIEDTGLDEGDIFVDAPKKSVLRETNASILGRDGGMRPLSEISTLVKSLNKAQMDHWRLYVFTPKEHMEKVSGATKRYFG